MNITIKKTIGILGGMGPEASSSLYKKMINYAQHKYNAVQDYEYPPIIIYSLALEGFDETGIRDEKLVKKQLIAGTKKLELAGCDFIIIGCNTVHCFYDDIQSAVKIPVFNIIEETLKHVLQHDYKKVGLFASESTTNLHLYKEKFLKSGVEVIEPNEVQQKELNRVIENVMGGNQGARDVIALKDIAIEYNKKGARAIVLGCTEIPLAINQSHTNIKLFDTVEIIVQTAVDYSIGT